jgi:Ca2+-binding EF-hand superfamily protein
MKNLFSLMAENHDLHLSDTDLEDIHSACKEDKGSYQELIKAYNWLCVQHIEMYQFIFGKEKGSELFNNEESLLNAFSAIPDRYLELLIEVWRKRTKQPTP